MLLQQVSIAININFIIHVVKGFYLRQATKVKKNIGDNFFSGGRSGDRIHKKYNRLDIAWNSKTDIIIVFNSSCE